MRMGFEQPINGQALLRNICDNCIRRRERCSPRSRIKIKHAINNRSLLGFRIVDHIADRESRFVEKGTNYRNTLLGVAHLRDGIV